MPVARSLDSIQVNNAGNTYYVNDDSLIDDEFTTALGDNSNSGKSPDRPMRSIQAVLAAHSLEPGDVLYVDSGDYILNSNITLGEEASGITVVGSQIGETVIDRANDAVGAYAFEFTGADNVTLDSLTITGGRVGVYAGATADSDGLTIRGSVLDSNRNEEIFLGTNNDGFSLDNSIVVDSGTISASGVSVDGNGVSVLDSEFQGHFDAIYLRGRGNQVSGSTIQEASNYGLRVSVTSDTGSSYTDNQVFGNHRGMVLTINQGVQALVQGNQVWQNQEQGIEATGNVLLDSNRAYENGGAGFQVQGVTATNNLAHENQDGFSVTGVETTLEGNRAFANLSYGIRGFGDSRLIHNRVYNNQVGIGLIQGSVETAIVTNNLIYDNVGAGLVVDEIDSRIWNNTIVQPLGVGVLLAGGAEQVRFENNIIQAGGDLAIEVSNFTSTLVDSDYNLVSLNDGAQFARAGASDVTDGLQWYQEFGQGRNSRIGTDSIFTPQFLDADGVDDVRGFVSGTDHGADDDFRLSPSSPAIDAANPRIESSGELSPNGSRSNLGAFGGSVDAASSLDSSLSIINPKPFSRFEIGTVLPIEWIAAGAAVVDPADAQYEQTVLNATPRGYWRLDDTGSVIQDISGSSNDGSIVGQVVVDQVGAFGGDGNAAMQFGESNSYVSIPNSASLNAPVFTVGAWVYANDELSDFDTIVSKTSSFTWNNGFGLYYHSGQVRFFVDDDSLTANPSAKLESHKWTHVLGTFDGNRASLYVDGVLAGTQEGLAGFGMASAPLNIGYGGTTDREWPGKIDEVTYFDRVLSGAEVAAQANRHATSTVEIALVDLVEGTTQTLESSLTTRGTLDWIVPSDLTPGANYQIQVKSQDTQAAFATSPLIQIVNPGNQYFVNDDSIIGDEYTTAVGSDANDGKTPDSPMKSIQALMQSYELGIGDVIFIDTGNYKLLSNLRLEEMHSGITIRGPEQIGNEAIFDRADSSTDSHVIELAGVDDAVLSNLSLTGGYHGVFAAIGAGSNRNQLLGIRSYDNLRTEVWLQDSNNENTIEGGEFFDSTATNWHGIQLDSDGNLVLDNRLQDHQYGIFSSNGNDNQFIGNQLVDNDRGVYAIVGVGQSVEINGNEALGGEYGIFVQGSFNTSTATKVVGNTTRNNSTDGIFSQGEVEVDFNTSFDNGRFGINLRNRGSATGNTTYRNLTGLRVGDSNLFASAFSNRSFGNSQFGIEAFEGSVADGNVSYSNSVGIVGTGISGFSGQLTNNLAYANTNSAMLVHKGRTGATAANNTAYQAVGEAFRVQGGSQNLVLRNNLLGVESGAAILVEAGSTVGFDSDFNLFDLLLPQTANVGSWSGTDATTLSDWQQLSGSGAASLVGTANFIDVDGVDNVYGYDALADGGNGFDGGLDDNFSTAAGSPAIDRANSAWAPVTDRFGASRADDPDTLNLGTNTFVESDLGSNQFAANGAPQNWRSANGVWSHNLPFTFSFFGQGYDQVFVSSNGLLQFGSSSNLTDGTNSAEELGDFPRISPLWDQLSTAGAGNDIFIQSSATDVTVRWQATLESDGSLVQFSAKLFDDGAVEFHYGDSPDSLSPTIGLSGGDGRSIVFGSYNGQTNLLGANSVRFDWRAGFADLGAFEFQGSSTDTLPPIIVSSSPSQVINAGGVSAGVNAVTVNFSEPINIVDASAIAAYDLRSSGEKRPFRRWR